MTIAKVVTYVTTTGLLGLCSIIAPPQAKASQWNQKTVMTFSAPVEIPGKVLPAGTYVFKVADMLSDRDVIEVYDQHEKHLYGTFLAIPNYHLRPSGKVIVRFEEREAGAPEAVKAWFYPGDNFGHEFVYPKMRATQLAKANNQTVASVPEPAAGNEQQAESMKQAPLRAENPNQTESEMSEAYPPQTQANNTPPPAAESNTPPPAQESNNPPVTQATNEMPSSLPKTGSPVPLIGLLGLLALGLAGTLRYASAKVK